MLRNKLVKKIGEIKLEGNRGKAEEEVDWVRYENKWWDKSVNV